MLLSWLRARRRRKLLAEPFPIRWDAIIGRNVGHFALLPPDLKTRLRDVTTILLAEKEWLGRGGLFVTRRCG
jgi:Mlc titration factor MtfA (ptsG expression regulator)